jgi:hypothetical protein
MGLIKAGNSQLQAGLMALPTGSDLKVLVACVSGATGSSGARVLGSSSNYVVPTGKVFKCLAVQTTRSATTASNAIGYADNSLPFYATTAPTNPIYSNGGSSTPISNITAISLDMISVCLKGFDIPAGKYLISKGNGGAGDCYSTIYGYEESV